MHISHYAHTCILGMQTPTSVPSYPLIRTHTPPHTLTSIGMRTLVVMRVYVGVHICVLQYTAQYTNFTMTSVLISQRTFERSLSHVTRVQVVLIVFRWCYEGSGGDARVQVVLLGFRWYY